MSADGLRCSDCRELVTISDRLLARTKWLNMQVCRCFDACYRLVVMRFLFAILAGFVLLLSVTSGAAASTSVDFEPSPTQVALEHHEGDGDQVPDCPVNNGTHHHHSSCNAHQMGAADDLAVLADSWSDDPMLAMTQVLLLAGLNPAFEPHPPKA